MNDARSIPVLQHFPCETLGNIERALRNAGLSWRYIRIDEQEPVPQSLADAPALIVMGGPMGVYEQERYPHLADELRLIRAAIDKQIPVLGVCLGSQLVAHALGAKVYPSGRKELGWHRVTLTDAATTDPIWKHAPQEFTAFHWHGDIFDLPPGATALASSDMTRIQAYRHGTNVYGILCHLEVDRALAHNMAAAFVDELQVNGGDLATIDRDSDRHLPQLTPIGEGIFAAWASLIAKS